MPREPQPRRGWRELGLRQAAVAGKGEQNSPRELTLRRLGNSVCGRGCRSAAVRPAHLCGRSGGAFLPRPPVPGGRARGPPAPRGRSPAQRGRSPRALAGAGQERLRVEAEVPWDPGRDTVPNQTEVESVAGSLGSAGDGGDAGAGARVRAVSHP